MQAADRPGIAGQPSHGPALIRQVHVLLRGGATHRLQAMLGDQEVEETVLSYPTTDPKAPCSRRHQPEERDDEAGGDPYNRGQHSTDRQRIFPVGIRVQGTRRSRIVGNGRSLRCRHFTPQSLDYELACSRTSLPKAIRFARRHAAAGGTADSLPIGTPMVNVLRTTCQQKQRVCSVPCMTAARLPDTTRAARLSPGEAFESVKGSRETLGTALPAHSFGHQADTSRPVAAPRQGPAEVRRYSRLSWEALSCGLRIRGWTRSLTSARSNRRDCCRILGPKRLGIGFRNPLHRVADKGIPGVRAGEAAGPGRSTVGCHRSRWPSLHVLLTERAASV